MRELPEIETIRRDLDRDIVGRKIKGAEAESMALLPRYNNRKSFLKLLDGLKVTGVSRVGLHLVVQLDNEHRLVVTLGEKGLALRNANRDKRLPGTEVVIGFTQGGQLRLVDPTGDAEVFVVSDDEAEELLPTMRGRGLDPLDQPISWTVFDQVLKRADIDLKRFLVDDEHVVGIGALYSDEILFNAGLRFDRNSRSLSTQEVRRLYRSLVETLHDAIKYRGTTLEGDDYTDPYGEPGAYGAHLQIYDREGELSPRSRAPILTTKYNGRTVYYCDTQV